jgi:hypothetical protein
LSHKINIQKKKKKKIKTCLIYKIILIKKNIK